MNNEIIFLEEDKMKFILIQNLGLGNINQFNFSIGIKYLIYKDIILKDFNDLLNKLNFSLKLKKPLRVNCKDYFSDGYIPYNINGNDITYNKPINIFVEIRLHNINKNE